MFDKMYQEQFFLYNRDLDAYRVKQAGACIFLLARLSDWMKRGPRNQALDVVLKYLRLVHTRQLVELGGPSPMKCPGNSFYYDIFLSKLYRLNGEGTHEEIPLIMMWAIMYERGRLRYEMLQSEGLPWADLRCDARSNRDLCVTYMVDTHGVQQTKSMTSRLVKVEAELVAEIDERNSKK